MGATALIVLGAMMPSAVAAQNLSGSALATALQRGGYVLVMRHANSPEALPDAQRANPDNLKRERQLDDAGRRGAEALGRVLVALKIPIGQVLSSPTYRALETVRRLGLQTWRVELALGEGEQSMQGVTEAQAAWLRARAQRPPSRTNLLLITHSPNIARAFPDSGMVAQGETLVFAAGGRLVARLTIAGWARLVP